MVSHTQEALAMLADAGEGPRFLFEGEAETLVGLGAREVLRGQHPDELLDMIEQAKGQGLWCGGVAFRPDHQPVAPWDAFDTVAFWHPQTTQRIPHTTSTMPSPTSPGQAHGPGMEPSPSAGPRDVPGPAESGALTVATDAWHNHVAEALNRLGPELHKLVLARHRARETAVSPERVLASLGRETAAHRFLVEPKPGHALVGATPERLVRLQDGLVTTHALAGTADAEGSLGGRKLQAEHDAVVQHIVARLKTVGATNIEARPRQVRQQRSMRHLETPITADFGGHVLELVHALHPTPAVAGAPVPASLEALHDLESWPRGWYSGAVGWFDGDGNGNFVVALRCALLRSGTAHLYAGAGLVPGSNAEAEWRETEWKMGVMEAAL